MIRCDSCATEVIVVDPNGDGIRCGCALSNPLERAAIALYRNFAEGMERSPVPWDSPQLDHTTLRQIFRRKAELALKAAINVDELAEHIGPDHAQTVRNHLLGSQEP